MKLIFNTGVELQEVEGTPAECGDFVRYLLETGVGGDNDFEDMSSTLVFSVTHKVDVRQKVSKIEIQASEVTVITPDPVPVEAEKPVELIPEPAIENVDPPVSQRKRGRPSRKSFDEWPEKKTLQFVQFAANNSIEDTAGHFQISISECKNRPILAENMRQRTAITARIERIEGAI